MEFKPNGTHAVLVSVSLTGGPVVYIAFFGMDLWPYRVPFRVLLIVQSHSAFYVQRPV